MTRRQLSAFAQHSAAARIGFLCGKSPEQDLVDRVAVWKGLNEHGVIEGQSISADYKWAHDQYDRLPALADELVRDQIAVIAAIGTTPAALAAKSATNAIPIVFNIGTDPIKIGLVASLNRPGSNVTGVTFLNRTLVPKPFEMLQEMVPAITAIGFLVNPGNPFAEANLADAAAAVSALGRRLLIAKASTKDELPAAMELCVRQQAGGIVVAGDLFLDSQHNHMTAFARDHALPIVYPWREAVVGGGLSYGANRTNAYHQARIYIGKMLRGEHPGDLPVQQATLVTLAINLKTAKALRINVPPTLLARADEVIE